MTSLSLLMESLSSDRILLKELFNEVNQEVINDFSEKDYTERTDSYFKDNCKHGFPSYSTLNRCHAFAILYIIASSLKDNGKDDEFEEILDRMNNRKFLLDSFEILRQDFIDSFKSVISSLNDIISQMNMSEIDIHRLYNPLNIEKTISLMFDDVIAKCQ